MPNILAVDTSTEACSCALHLNGRVFESFQIMPRKHADNALAMISALLSEHDVSFKDLDAIAYGQGPGSFTGLRIAAGITQGIAFAADIPVLPVSTLAAIASQACGDDKSACIFSTLDARIDEIYWGIYQVDAKTTQLLGKEGLCKPELLPENLAGNPNALVGAGSGMLYFNRMPKTIQTLFASQNSELYPRASQIVKLALPSYNAGIWQTAEEVNPVYLRDKVTHSR